MSQKTIPIASLNVLFDIDGTLTDDIAVPQIDSRYVMGNALFEIFTDRLYKMGMKRKQAEKVLHQYAEQKKYWDYDDFVKKFNIPEPEIWTVLTLWHKQNLQVFKDGTELVERLFRQGYPLHIVSNNPYMGCMLKLEAAGLGTLEGSEYFHRIFCSNKQLGQKHDLSFWERVLSSSGIVPDHTVIIGNNLHEDYEVPRQLGFHSSYIVDREKKLPPSPDPSHTGLHVVHSLQDVNLGPALSDLHLLHI